MIEVKVIGKKKNSASSFFYDFFTSNFSGNDIKHAKVFLFPDFKYTGDNGESLDLLIWIRLYNYRTKVEGEESLYRQSYLIIIKEVESIKPITHEVLNTGFNELQNQKNYLANYIVRKEKSSVCAFIHTFLWLPNEKNIRTNNFEKFCILNGLTSSNFLKLLSEQINPVKISSDSDYFYSILSYSERFILRDEDSIDIRKLVFDKTKSALKFIKMNQNKIFIAIGILIILLFGSTYLIFSNSVKAAKLEIKELDKKLEQSLDENKNKYFKAFSEKNPGKEDYFLNSFNNSKKLTTKDTLISFFVYRTMLTKYQFEEESYFKCLILKCEADINKDNLLKNLDDTLKDISNTNGELAENLLKKIDIEKFITTKPKNCNCTGFFKDSIVDASINTNAIKEFEEMIMQFKGEEKKYLDKSITAKNRYNILVNNALITLNNAGKNELNQFLSNKSFLRDVAETSYYKGRLLGNISYEFKEVIVDEDGFNLTLNKIQEDQYKNNSLLTGYTPYAYCYGNNTGCSYGCSKISVKTPNSSDVLVTIKKNNDVYQHAYIKAGSTYVFNLPNGTYQTFFYYGKGWNPNKFMKNASCGPLKGGFVSDELFGKDYPQTIYNQILSYELILQQNGNFSTKPSNSNEAL